MLPDEVSTKPGPFQFQLCDKSIEDRTQLVIELRGLYPEMEYELKEKLIAFLNAENEFVRSKRAFYREQMNLSSQLEQVQDLLRDTPTSSYEREWWLKRASEIREESLKTTADLIQAGDTFSEKYEAMTTQEGDLAQAMQEEGLRFRQIFSEFNESNLDSVGSAKENANAMRDVVRQL